MKSGNCNFRINSILLILSVVILSVTIINISNVQAGTLYGVNDDTDSLYSIDTDTLVFSEIGSLGVTFNYGGLAYDHNNDILYMIGGRNNNNLYSVNRSTGLATLIGSHGLTDLFGLAYDSANNVLYASSDDNSRLYTLDTGTGAATQVGYMGEEMCGLAYNSTTDTLIAIDSRSTGERLYSINRTTAATTLLYTDDGDGNNVGGLAYDPDKNLYWYIDAFSRIYSYDIANGYLRDDSLSGLTYDNRNAYLDGLAYLSTAAPQAPTAIPTINEWGMIILSLLLAGASVFLIRKQQAKN